MSENKYTITFKTAIRGHKYINYKKKNLKD
ncbi:Uncharacterised protein [Pasteurella multocida]|nr:Uncharacterised protein [Pasteurella multocida]